MLPAKELRHGYPSDEKHMNLGIERIKTFEQPKCQVAIHEAGWGNDKEYRTDVSVPESVPVCEGQLATAPALPGRFLIATSAG
jgi:hypothetical protein